MLTDTVSDQGDEIKINFLLSNADHIETGQTRIYKYGTKQKYINLIYYKRNNRTHPGWLLSVTLTFSFQPEGSRKM